MTLSASAVLAIGTRRPFPALTHKRSSGPSLPGGPVVRAAQAVLRPPPTPSRHPATSRLAPVIDRDVPTAHSAGGRAGEGLQFPSSPSERSTPSTPRSSSGLRSRLSTPSMAFTQPDEARLSLIHAHDAAGSA